MGTLQTKHPVRATLVLGSGATGGNGGAGGGGGGGGTGGSAGSRRRWIHRGRRRGRDRRRLRSGGGAGRGGTSGTAGAGGTGGASGSGGVAGTTGRGGTGGGGTGGGGRGGGAAGTGGAAGGADGRHWRHRNGWPTAAPAAPGRPGGTGTAGRGGTGGTGTGGAPLCMVVPVLTPGIASEIPLSVLGNMTECGYPIMGSGIIMYAAVNGSRFALIRDLEFAQSAACGRCIEVTATDVARATVVTVVGSCNAIPGVPCAANGGVLLSPPAYAAVATGATQFPVTWRYVPCQPSGPGLRAPRADLHGGHHPEPRLRHREGRSTGPSHPTVDHAHPVAQQLLGRHRHHAVEPHDPRHRRQRRRRDRQPRPLERRPAARRPAPDVRRAVVAAARLDSAARARARGVQPRRVLRGARAVGGRLARPRRRRARARAGPDPDRRRTPSPAARPPAPRRAPPRPRREQAVARARHHAADPHAAPRRHPAARHPRHARQRQRGRAGSRRNPLLTSKRHGPLSLTLSPLRGARGPDLI